MNSTSGGSIFLSLLKEEGVTHMFGNPGTTELPIMHAMREHQDLTYVLGLQESLVVAMADGFSRASGKLVACNVHVAPGLGFIYVSAPIIKLKLGWCFIFVRTRR